MIFWRKTMIRSYTLAAAAVMTAVTGFGAWAADPLPTETFKVLPAALAVEAAQAAMAQCKTQGYNVTVTIVDRTGATKLQIVADNGNRIGPDLSRRKAYTSALLRVSTGDYKTRIATPGAFNPGVFDAVLTTEQGGLPIKVGNETIGGIGASGAPGGEKDEACAAAGLAKISDRLN
jgi:uncharacterized protein GlcG (DUF336 family)